MSINAFAGIEASLDSAACSQALEVIKKTCDEKYESIRESLKNNPRKIEKVLKLQDELKAFIETAERLRDKGVPEPMLELLDKARSYALTDA